jgi:hypothetical protein
MENKTIILRRFASNEDGVFGGLIDVVNGKEIPFAITVEPEDKNNQSNISCIPPGEYEAFLREAETSRRDYDVWELLNVPGRTNIQIHKGVTEDSSLGCIIVGESFEPYKSKTAGVMQSTKGIEELMERTKGYEKIKIIIEKCYS